MLAYYVLDTILSILHMLIIYSLQKLWVDSIIICILWREKQRHKEVK